MADDKQRVFIVDDDRSVRSSLSRLLHSAGYETKVFGSATEFLQYQPYDGKSCLILDVMMPGIDGINLHRQLAAKRSNLPVIFLTAHGDLPMGVRAMKRGAEDFLQKPVDETVLLNAVSQALARYETTSNDDLNNSKLSSALDALTPRELEILQLILGGATNQQIAEFFGISAKTVKAHRGKIMQKTGASSAAELGWICSSSQLTAIKV
jgi:FixJ family two-component response regulator